MNSKYIEKKQSIIEATKRIIAEQGFNKLTLRQVAAEADMSPGTLYYYYNSKNMILYDVLDQSTREAVNLAEEMKNKAWNQDDILARQIDILYRRVLDIEGNRILLYLYYEALSGDAELADKLKEKFESWRKAMEEVYIMYFNIPRSPMSRALAIIMDALVDGLCWQQLLNLETISDPGVAQFLNLFFAGRHEEILQGIKQGRIAEF